MGLNKDLFEYCTAALGLQGTIITNEGVTIQASASRTQPTYQIMKDRYSQFMQILNPSLSPQELKHHVLIHMNAVKSFPKTQFKQLLTDEKRSHGSILSVVTGWEDHGITINFMSEGIGNNHLIQMLVFNKSQISKSGPSEFLSQPVQCYTFKAPMSAALVDKIYTTCLGNQYLGTVKQAFEKLFLSSELVSARNYAISSMLTKSFQKIGNCGVANRNIVMHLNLASEEMVRTGHCFFESYKTTRSLYKQLRFLDRQDALFTLVNMKDQMKKAGWLDLIIQAIGKFSNKYEKGKISTSFANILEVIQSKVDETTFNEIISAIKEMDSVSLNAQIAQKSRDTTEKEGILAHNVIGTKKYMQIYIEIEKLKRSSRLCQDRLQAKKEYVKLFQRVDSEEKSTTVVFPSDGTVVTSPFTVAATTETTTMTTSPETLVIHHSQYRNSFVNELSRNIESFSTKTAVSSSIGEIKLQK